MEKELDSNSFQFIFFRRVFATSTRTLWLWIRSLWLHSGQTDRHHRLAVEKRSNPNLLYWSQRRPHIRPGWGYLHGLTPLLRTPQKLHPDRLLFFNLIGRILPSHGGLSYAAWPERPPVVPDPQGLQGAPVPDLLLSHVRLWVRSAQRPFGQRWRRNAAVETQRRAEHHLAEGKGGISVWQTASGTTGALVWKWNTSVKHIIYI